jgi:hypothetical protein
MEDSEVSTPTARPRRWRLVLMMGVLTAGIAIGSATTSVVWANHQFDDVPTTNQFHGDITWANNHDIVNGFADGGFHPTAPVSRQAFTAFLRRYNAELEVVNHGGTILASVEGTNTVTCPAGKRPLAGGGNTDAFNMMMTDMNISSTSVSIRWETDNNVAQSATTNAWALCAPTV